MRIEFSVPAVPVAQPRPRATMAHGGKGARMHEVTHIKKADGTRKEHPIVAFKATIRMAASATYTAAPLEGPLSCSVMAIFPRTTGRPPWIKKGTFWFDAWNAGARIPHITRPDRDNVEKAVLDAMKGITFVDDSQVVCGPVEKWVASATEQPHVEVVIETLTEAVGQ